MRPTTAISQTPDSALRRDRITSGMLPFWLGMQGARRMPYKPDELVMNLRSNYGGFGSKVDKRLQNDAAQNMLDYARAHEDKGLRAYMEVTGALVKLGAVHVRDEEANDEYEHTGPKQWWLYELLSSAPDGHILDPAEGGNAGVLEVHVPSGVHRHDAELRIHPERDTYALLQAWQHLFVDTEAMYVDIVYWKGAQQSREQWVWVSRLYRGDRRMRNIREYVAKAADVFHALVYERKRSAGATDALSEEDRHALHVELREWAYESLKWRNAHEPAEGFPWRSRRDLEDRDLDADGLCHRYTVSTGAAATHNYEAERYAAGGKRFGYRVLEVPPGVPVIASRLWPKQQIG